ncbi:hypothetical protein, partial [Methylogaea oryzae]
MAEENENPNGGAGAQAADGQQQEAQLFDDLTVLSRGEEGDQSNRGETVGGTPEQVEGSGNENLQTDVRGEGAILRDNLGEGASGRGAAE